MLPMPSSSTSETGKLCRISVSPTLLSKLAETRKRSVPDKKKKKSEKKKKKKKKKGLWCNTGYLTTSVSGQIIMYINCVVM